MKEYQPAGYYQGMSLPGSTGGVATTNDLISQVSVSAGQRSVRNDFCEELPVALSGYVWADPQGDCVLGPQDIRLKDVKMELLDANGHVVASTLTDVNGYYHFDNLEPGKVYSRS